MPNDFRRPWRFSGASKPVLTHNDVDTLDDPDAPLTAGLIANGFGGGGNLVTSVNGNLGAVVLDAADVGARPSSYVPAWGEVTGKPATFAPAAHEHAGEDITSGVINRARLGSGSPVAGTYVDGGTGVWTEVPQPQVYVRATSSDPIPPGTAAGTLIVTMAP